MIRKCPHLIEINAFSFLKRASEKYKKRLTLDSIPDEEWQSIAAQGFDLVWMMGVWERSPGARQCALSDAGLLHEYGTALADFKDSDVAGSPYAVYNYDLDPSLGEASGLLKLRENLKRAGLDLILDYVPNHLAFDHRWTRERPECFLEVSEEVSKKNSGFFFKTPKQRFLGHGRDPHFSPWTDTVQINFFSPRAREAAVETLLKIARSSGGVRCDMAMLGLNRVFETTWGAFLENTPRPPMEFWTEVIEKVRAQYPGFIFIAEVYWDLEWELQRLGFQFTYDKKLYDRLIHAEPSEIRGHLNADLRYQEHSVRFIENHDEPRAVKAFGLEKSCAAAVIIATLPGMRFFQEGQMQGKQIKIPVQLGREPREKGNPELPHFYGKLLKYAHDRTLHEGLWQKAEAVPAGNGQTQYVNFLAWCWQQGRKFRWVIVNYSPSSAHGRIFFQSAGLLSGVIKLKDVLTGAIYERDSGEIKDRGLYAALGPWKAHLFEFETE